MTYYRIGGRFLTAHSGALLTLMAAGFLAVVYRFSLGLGSTTGMTDQFPWGIWVGFDVLCGVAVTSGCFTTAAIVYLFFNRSCMGLVRPALLTAFLGYVFVVVGVLFDLGLPWMIWHPIVYWPQKSPMFLVAWCDMLLLVTLGLMFLPAVFERFVRGAESRVRIAGSTGLGLAIVDAIVHAHGGSIEVTSAPGRTAFLVRLPAGTTAVT